MYQHESEERDMNTRNKSQKSTQKCAETRTNEEDCQQTTLHETEPDK